MKKLYTIAISIFLFSGSVYAQNNVGINTSAPDASAALDVTSTSQGMLVPRMSKAQRDAINQINGTSTPANGLLIYQTDNTPGFYFYNGSSWTSLNGAQGPKGEPGNPGSQGIQGLQGAPGQGIPIGGTVGQVISKVDGTDYNTAWTTPSTATTLPSQSGNSGKFLKTDGSALSWESSSGAKVELFVKKTAATQALVGSTSANPDLVVYDNIITAPTVGSYNTSTNTYTVGGAGLYLIQTRNSMVDNATPSNTLGAYNYLEINGSSYGSMLNIYPTYTSNASQRGVTNIAIKSSTQYIFFVVLNAGDTIKIKATSANSSITQSLNNDGGTQLMVVKL